MSTDTGTREPARSTETPFRYGAALAEQIEQRWQDRWEREGTFAAPDPGEPGSEREKVYLLDMFPYPSGAGLHVGHPLGFIGTDVLGRYLRMTGHNVLHAMGFDAFGLPAEQYAVQTGTHPRKTTEENIERYRAQLRQLGLGHDDRRSVRDSRPDGLCLGGRLPLRGPVAADATRDERPSGTTHGALARSPLPGGGGAFRVRFKGGVKDGSS